MREKSAIIPRIDQLWRYNTSYIQSFMQHYLFILFSVLFSVAHAHEATAPDTGTIPNSNKKTDGRAFRFGIRAATTFHAPFSHTGDHWNPYLTAGLHFDIPTYVPAMQLHFSAEAGSIDRSDGVITDVTIIHSAISLSCDVPLVKDKLSLRPRLGLSNVTIATGTLMSAGTIQNMELFADNENEFGGIAGIEPVYRIRRVLITLPVTGTIIFSSPHPMLTADITLTAGVVF